MTIFKSLPLESMELRFEGNTRKFRGYASTFNGNDSYGDTILPGAYLKTLADNGMPKMFFAHDWGLPVGKWLSAVEDEKGLLVEGELTPGNPQSDAILAAMKHGTVDGLSIGFRLSEGDYERKKDGGRIIKSVSKLYEISIVNFPADGDARVSEIRSEEIDELQTIRDFENFLREAGGFSKSTATSIVAKAKKLFATQRESEEEEKMATQLLERVKKLELSLS